jgi:hypothetical protein
MAKFKSVYPSLGFYVNDQLHNFTEGRYETDEPAFIDVLSKLSDVSREEVAPAPKAKAPAKPKAPPKAKAGE